ncbi:MAG: hypothetical protein PHV42_02935 [Candidatus Pacebacteria bacterium]|nr:hypothetical protein [Candidatus Paceibacterota bacterium]
MVSRKPFVRVVGARGRVSRQVLAYLIANCQDDDGIHFTESDTGVELFITDDMSLYRKLYDPKPVHSDGAYSLRVNTTLREERIPTVAHAFRAMIARGTGWTDKNNKMHQEIYGEAPKARVFHLWQRHARTEAAQSVCGEV